MKVVRLLSEHVDASLKADLRALLWSSFDDFTEDDWRHGLGGVHMVAFDGDRPVGHASVVSRTLYVGVQRYDAGYLEAVAVDATYRGRGIGASIVQMAGEVIGERYPLAALSTNEHGFYELLGWERWRGPAYVVADAVWVRRADEDDGIMVLRTPACLVADLTVPIAVNERNGDDW